MVWWVDNSTAPQVRPLKQAVYSKVERWFTDKIGDTPTVPQADWFNMIQSEILGIAKSLGVTPDKLNDEQIGAALTIALAKVKPIAEGGTGAVTAVDARKNLGLGSSATLNKTDAFGTSTNLVATQLLVDKLQKELLLAMSEAIPVGVVTSWDYADAPKGWLMLRGQTYSKTDFPGLAKFYPSGKLADRRGVVERGLDFGRGFDAGRALGSYQEDAMQKISGRWNGGYENMPWSSGSVLFHKDRVFDVNGNHVDGASLKMGTTPSGSFDSFSLDSSLETRTANETRMKNIATNFIVKAK